MIPTLKHPGGERTFCALLFFTGGLYFLISGVTQPSSNLVILGGLGAAVGAGLWLWQSWARWGGIVLCLAMVAFQIWRVIQHRVGAWGLLLVVGILWLAWDVWRHFHPRERRAAVGSGPPPDAARLQRAIEQFGRGDYDECKKAEEIIARAGKAGIAPLLAFLREDDEDLPWLTGQALRKLGAPALSALMELIQGSDVPLKHRGLRALWEFEEDGLPAIPVLLNVLTSQDPAARGRAVHALGRMGRGCARALPQILAATRDPDPQVRWSAAYALERSGKTTGEVRTALIQLLSDADPTVRSIAISASSKVFSRSLPPLEVFKALLRDPDPDVLEKMFDWIGELGPRSPDVTPELAQALANPGIDLAAAEALWAHARRGDLVMPVVLRHLSTGEGCKPETASDLVAKMGPAAHEAVPRLVDLLKNDDDDLQWAVSDALAAIGPAAGDAISLLVRNLEHQSGLVASSTARALAKVGPTALGPVLEVLKTGSPRAKEFAADCLGRMGDEAEGAVPILVRLADEPSGPSDLRCWALLALGEIRPLAEAVEAIAALLEEGLGSDMRARASAVLGRIGPEARAGIAALQKASSDPDEMVARAAREALEEIGG